jgi:hypothetical protein
MFFMLFVRIKLLALTSIRFWILPPRAIKLLRRMRIPSLKCKGAEEHCLTQGAEEHWPTPVRQGRYNDEASSSGLRSSVVHCTRILRNREIRCGRATHGIRPLGGDSPTIAHVA